MSSIQQLSHNGQLQSYLIQWWDNVAQHGKINNEVSTELTTKSGPLCCHGDALMFIQSDINSLMDQLNTSSKTIKIPNTLILLESQSTIDVFCNGELLTQIHKTNITLRIGCNAGMKTKNTRGHLLGYRSMWLYLGDSQHLVYEQDEREIQNHFW